MHLSPTPYLVPETDSKNEKNLCEDCVKLFGLKLQIDCGKQLWDVPRARQAIQQIKLLVEDRKMVVIATKFSTFDILNTSLFS